MKGPTKTIVALFGGALLLCEQAQAALISGGIEFFGSATASGPSGPPDTIHFIDPWHVLAGIGSYAGVPSGTPTTFADFTFIGDGSTAILLAPDTPIWTFTIGATTYSFDFLAMTNGHVESGSMSFTGTGVADITGFEPTPTYITIQGTGHGFDFRFSSCSIGSIPEGNTMALVILGLMSIGGVVALRKK